MRRIRIAQQALRLTAEPSQHQHICRVCLGQAVRRIHTSVPHNAKVPFLKSLRDTFFGSKKADVGEKKKETGITEAEASPEKRPTRTERTIKGQVYQVAPREGINLHSEYIPASRWDGLKHVGSTDWVEEQAGKGPAYVGYLRQKQSTVGNERWRRLLHHVALRVLAGSDGDTVPLPPNTRIAIEDGEACIEYVPAREAEPQSGQSQQQATQKETQDSDTKYEIDEARDLSWMKMKLTDPKIKFSVAKRIMKITNRRIPDYVLSRASTMAELYEGLKIKEQPKRLYETKEMKKLRVSKNGSNVAVYPTRRTPVHAELQVGRWKVIEKELQSRDLPIFGSRHSGVKEPLRRV